MPRSSASELACATVGAASRHFRDPARTQRGGRRGRRFGKRSPFFISTQRGASSPNSVGRRPGVPHIAGRARTKQREERPSPAARCGKVMPRARSPKWLRRASAPVACWRAWHARRADPPRPFPAAPEEARPPAWVARTLAHPASPDQRRAQPRWQLCASVEQPTRQREGPLTRQSQAEPTAHAGPHLDRGHEHAEHGTANRECASRTLHAPEQATTPASTCLPRGRAPRAQVLDSKLHTGPRARQGRVSACLTTRCVAMTSSASRAMQQQRVTRAFGLHLRRAA
jgi:hypothetical protein